MINDLSDQNKKKNRRVPPELALKEENINIYIGRKLSKRRERLAYPKSTIADRIGVTTQQLQKIESGETPISASQLYLIASGIGVEVDYFFKGIDQIMNGNKSHYSELRFAAGDIADDKLRDAILGIIDITKKRPEKR